MRTMSTRSTLLVIEGVADLDLGTPDGCRLLDEALPAAIRARHERGA